MFTHFCDINIVFRNTWHNFECVAMVLNLVQCVEAMRLWRKIKWIPSAAVGEANIALLWLSACGPDKIMMSFTFTDVVVSYTSTKPLSCTWWINILFMRHFHANYKSNYRDEEKECGLDSPRKVWIPFTLSLASKLDYHSFIGIKVKLSLFHWHQS